MRIIVFFDLPVKTKKQRKVATKFRNTLVKEGFMMLQYSVYTRICNGPDAAERYEKRIQKYLPPEGNVRLMTVTEKQFANMKLLVGDPPKNEEKVTYEQLSLF